MYEFREKLGERCGRTEGDRFLYKSLLTEVRVCFTAYCSLPGRRARGMVAGRSFVGARVSERPGEPAWDWGRRAAAWQGD